MPSARLPISLFAFVLLVAGCSPTHQPSPVPSAVSSSVAPGPLLTVEWRGGLCPQGLCQRTIEIDTDGTVREGVPPRVLGQLAPALIDRLSSEMARADFARIQSRPFTGTCPMAYDGQEIVYTFHAPSGIEAIASCTVAVDPSDPLFRAADAAIAAIPAGS